MCIYACIYIYTNICISRVPTYSLEQAWRGWLLPEKQRVGWGSSAWNRGLPHASSPVWRIPKSRRVTADRYLLQSPQWGRRQFSTRHAAELWIPLCWERALQLYASSGRLSKVRGAFTGVCWLPGSCPAWA